MKVNTKESRIPFEPFRKRYRVALGLCGEKWALGYAGGNLITLPVIWLQNIQKIGTWSVRGVLQPGSDYRDRKDSVEVMMADICEPHEKSIHCIVSASHAFLLRITSFCGLAPLKFEKQGNRYIVTISNSMCAFNYIFVSVQALYVASGLFRQVKAGVMGPPCMTSLTSQFVLVFHVIVLIVTASTGICSAPQRMRDMFKLMKTVALVDISLGQQYSLRKEKKMCAILLADLLIMLGLNSSDMTLLGLNMPHMFFQIDELLYNLGFYINILIIPMLEVQFAFSTFLVHTRFQAVNNYLYTTIRNIAVPVSGEPKLIRFLESIRCLVNLHGSLCDAVHFIDRTYGLLLMMILTTFFLQFIIKANLFIVPIITLNYDTPYLVLQFAWCVLYMIRIIIVIEQCHQTITEAKKTEELICQLMTKGKLPSRVELFSRQLMLQTVTYSPMGMCTLDRPFVVSVLGAIATYLIVILQFQESESGKKL